MQHNVEVLYFYDQIFRFCYLSFCTYKIHNGSNTVSKEVLVLKKKYGKMDAELLSAPTFFN